MDASARCFFCTPRGTPALNATSTFAAAAFQQNGRDINTFALTGHSSRSSRRVKSPHLHELVRQHERSHGVHHGHCAGDHAGVVAAARNQVHLLPVAAHLHRTQTNVSSPTLDPPSVLPMHSACAICGEPSDERRAFMQRPCFALSLLLPIAARANAIFGRVKVGCARRWRGWWVRPTYCNGRYGSPSSACG